MIRAKKIGHNTDGVGFVKSLQEQLGLNIPDHRYLILGSVGLVPQLHVLSPWRSEKNEIALYPQDYFCAETLYSRVNAHFPGVCENRGNEREDNKGGYGGA
jgi:shikimate dehydrogenase (EC 1.1.1.25)